MKTSKTASEAAEEAAAVAPLIGRRFQVMDPGAYWGAYKPVLTALQATGHLDALPLGDCLLRCENTDRAPPYLRHAAPVSRKASMTNLAALAGTSATAGDGSTHSGDAAAAAAAATGRTTPSSAFGYDIRPILNTTSQDSPYRIADVRREWPSAKDNDSGSSLDTWQLKAAKALLTRRLGLVQGPPGTGKTLSACLL